jgi:hypothetical protein
MERPKEPREDAKLQNLPEEELEVMWRFRHPEPGGKKLKLTAIAAVQVPLRYGFSISLSSLSYFYKWLAVRRDFRESRDVVYQIKEELKRDPSMSLEAIERAGVIMLATGGIQRKDGKLFSAMMKIGQGRTKLEQNDKRLKQTDKTLAQNDRRIQLLEEAAAEAKAKILALTTAAKSTGGLTPETLKQIEEAAGLL